jgi:hypothetical protein
MIDIENEIMNEIENVAIDDFAIVVSGDAFLLLRNEEFMRNKFV